MTCTNCGSDSKSVRVLDFTAEGIARHARVTKCDSCGFYVVNVIWKNPLGGEGCAGWTKFMSPPSFVSKSPELKEVLNERT